MKKAFIIVVSILSAVIVILSIILFSTKNSLTATSASLENLYQRSFYDLVDNVTIESSIAGRNAALYAMGKLNKDKEHLVKCGNGVRYTVPSSFYEGGENLDIYFRVSKKFVNANIIVTCNGEEVFKKFALAYNPSEMVTISVPKEKLNGDIEIFIKE